jgi:hypothetical protein
LTTRVCVYSKTDKPFDIDCRRPGPWGNQFVIGVHGDRRTCVKLFKAWYAKQTAEFKAEVRKVMTNKKLGCACHAKQECHVDVYVQECDGTPIPSYETIPLPTLFGDRRVPMQQ